MIAYSYGATTAANAITETGLDLNAFIMLSAAGRCRPAAAIMTCSAYV